MGDAEGGERGGGEGDAAEAFDGVDVELWGALVEGWGVVEGGGATLVIFMVGVVRVNVVVSGGVVVVVMVVLAVRRDVVREKRTLLGR